MTNENRDVSACTVPLMASRPADIDRVIVDNATTAVLLLDRELRVIAMNPAAEELLDVSANQVTGSRAQRLLPEARLFVAALERAATTGEPLTERDLQLHLPGPSTITVDCSLTPVGDGEAPRRVLVELVPLDRQKRITREEQLHMRGESVRALMRGLAHEIRNPLGGLRGAAQLLERELADEGLREYTQVIVREADRLQSLLDRMLGPRTAPSRRPINIHEVTEHVHALLAAEAPPGVRVEKDYDPSIPPLSADPELLIQALLNVARNAVQAVRGEGKVVLRTRVHRQYTIGQQRHRLVARIDVCDDGPGVPEALREHVFYPLVTGRDEGIGLGLSIAQSIVHRHGGLIECESEPGDTTFSLILPVEERA